MTCTRCSIHLDAPKHPEVKGRGTVEQRPRLLLIGEAPGETEDQTGVAFTGKSGMLLDAALEDAKVRSYWVTNACRCRPAGNRKPSMDEIRACREAHLRPVSYTHLTLPTIYSV